MKTNSCIRYIATLLGSLVMVSAQANAKPGKGNSDGKSKDKGGSNHSQVANDSKKTEHAGKSNDKSDKKNHSNGFTKFKDNERSEIVDYFVGYQNQNNSLPPGLAMNQQRGKTLPEGWQNKHVSGYQISDDEWSSYSPVPSAWFPNLRMENNTRLYHYGDRVVRVYEPRREVIEVIILPSGR